MSETNKEEPLILSEPGAGSGDPYHNHHGRPSIAEQLDDETEWEIGLRKEGASS